MGWIYNKYRLPYIYNEYTIYLKYAFNYVWEEYHSEWKV